MNKEDGEHRMINLSKDSYYSGYHDTDEYNPTVMLLYCFDTEKQFKSVEELSDNIREQANKK